MKKLSMKYFSDESKLKESENTLYDSSYIRVLAETFEECETPLTFALQGSWGTGKTTMMNMVNELLQKNDKVDFYAFNAWQFSQFGFGEQLPLVMLSHLINDLNRGIKPKGPFGIIKQFFISIKDVIINIVKTLGDILLYKTLGYNNIIKDISNMSKKDKDAIERLSKLQKNFEYAVDAKLKYDKKSKMLIFIDDIDRLEPNKAVELLECIKIFCVCKNCLFVLAVDYDVVLKGAKLKFEEKGKDFFDKIIQVPFIMPVANNLENYIGGLLKQSYDEVSNQEFKNKLKSLYAEIAKKTIGGNPRSIKRLLNSFIINDTVMIEKGLYDKVGNDEDIAHHIRVLLLFLVCVQNKNQKLYNNLIEISRRIITDYSAMIKDMKDYVFEFENVSKNPSFTKSILADVKEEDIDLETLNELYIRILKLLKDVKSLDIIKNVFDISESTNIVSETEDNTQKLELQKISKENLDKWEDELTRIYDELKNEYAINKKSMPSFYSFSIQNTEPIKLGYNCKLLMANINFIYELPIYDTIKLRLDIIMQYDDMPGFTPVTKDKLPKDNINDLDLVETNIHQMFGDIDKGLVVEELVEGLSTIKYKNIKTFNISDNAFDDIKKSLSVFIEKFFMK